MPDAKLTADTKSWDTSEGRWKEKEPEVTKHPGGIGLDILPLDRESAKLKYKFRSLPKKHTKPNHLRYLIQFFVF